jgi:aminopeptidase
MPDPRVKNLARIVVEYCVEVQPKNRVAIIGYAEAAPLIKELYREVLKAGGYPLVNVQLEGMDYIFYKEASDDQLQYINPMQELVTKEFEQMIMLFSSPNTRSLSNIDPAKQRMQGQAYSELSKIRMQRAASGEQKWNISMYPTNAHAQEAEMCLSDFQDYVYGTCFADTDNPVERWLELSKKQERLVKLLSGKKQVEIKGPNVDLRLSIEGRKFKNSDGKTNMPSGEIFTGPVEDSVEGWIRFSYPGIFLGREIEDIELTFEKGQVEKATAKKNEETLLKLLDTDEGARYVGEFAIGTNERVNRFIKNMLFDEKMAGTIHLALGSGFPETGSKNVSSLHWDMLCDMHDGGQIFVDGDLIYESGEFKT